MAAISLALVLVACNGNDEARNNEAPSNEISSTTEAQDTTPMNMTDSPTTLAEQIEFSKNALAQRLGTEPESITLSEARHVNWRSGAGGCPKPGMSYTQALVPGVLIILSVGNEAYHYHARKGAETFYCPRERAEKPALLRGAD